MDVFVTLAKYADELEFEQHEPIKANALSIYIALELDIYTAETNDLTRSVSLLESLWRAGVWGYEESYDAGLHKEMQGMIEQSFGGGYKQMLAWERTGMYRYYQQLSNALRRAV